MPDMMFESFARNDPYGDMAALGINELAVSSPVLTASVENSAPTQGSDDTTQVDSDALVVASLDYDEVRLLSRSDVYIILLSFSHCQC